ncbi:MAG: adenine deaminase [Bacteroidota bacterium]
MRNSSFTIRGRLADLQERSIYPAEIHVSEGKIAAIRRLEKIDTFEEYVILPGFIDSHVHIESSMLVPSEFARLAVVHGTVCTVSDPHEIANVCGLEGVDYMIANGRQVPFHFYFGAPSCVPATAFETAGAVLDAAAVEELLQRNEVRYLSELMNFPGVLQADPEVMQKIAAARRVGKPVDGHAPGLRGEQVLKYIAAGISTDHECFTAGEALEKLQAGMKILIREGSAARNFEALIGLLEDWPDRIMFCSDDKHPDSLLEGHINRLCARAVAKGIDPFNVLKAACLNPVLHYGLDVGLLRVGDPADLILVRDLHDFEVMETYIRGIRVAEQGRSLIQRVEPEVINRFDCREKAASDLIIPWKGESEIPVIEALDGQLITNRLMLPPRVEDGSVVSDPERDILKIVVVNRYREASVAKAFIRNFGLRRGALASSVAHDSHNIVAVGVDDESLCRAINKVIQMKGGISVADHSEPGDENGEWRSETGVALPVGGLMSPADGYEVAQAYTAMDAAAKGLGSTLSAPFMTLSFMALLVIPHLKLSDKGLFDGDSFQFI